MAGCSCATFFSGATAISTLNEADLHAAVPDPAARYAATTPLSTVFYGDLLTMQQTAANFGITVALCFGMAITVLVYNIAHISGGQVGCGKRVALMLVC